LAGTALGFKYAKNWADRTRLKAKQNSANDVELGPGGGRGAGADAGAGAGTSAGGASAPYQDQPLHAHQELVDTSNTPYKRPEGLPNAPEWASPLVKDEKTPSVASSPLIPDPKQSQITSFFKPLPKHDSNTKDKGKGREMDHTSPVPSGSGSQPKVKTPPSTKLKSPLTIMRSRPNRRILWCRQGAVGNESLGEMRLHAL